MAKSVTSIQNAFSKIDLKLIQKVEKKIEKDMDEALAWASDPDGYMFAKLKGTSRPKGLHFHIKVGKDLFPADTVVPSNQITFSTMLKLKPNIRKAVVAKVGKRLRRSAKPLYCEGCGYCRIAVI